MQELARFRQEQPSISMLDVSRIRRTHTVEHGPMKPNGNAAWWRTRDINTGP